MKIGELFKEEPMQWGLRGDPYLWKEMKAYFENTEIPPNKEELKRRIIEAYEEITKHSFEEREHFVIERFKHGGMSSGGISPEFWVSEGIPLLLSRHASPNKD